MADTRLFTRFLPQTNWLAEMRPSFAAMSPEGPPTYPEYMWPGGLMNPPLNRPVSGKTGDFRQSGFVCFVHGERRCSERLSPFPKRQNQKERK